MLYSFGWNPPPPKSPARPARPPRINNITPELARLYDENEELHQQLAAYAKQVHTLKEKLYDKQRTRHTNTRR